MKLLVGPPSGDAGMRSRERGASSIVSAVSVLGNDPYFPELDALREEAIDRIAAEIQAMHDEARSVAAPRHA